MREAELNQILKLDLGLTDYLSKYETLKQRSVPIENACTAALKLKKLVEQRIALIQQLKKLEVMDIRKNHTYEVMARYLIQRKYNHSARVVTINEDVGSPVNLKKFIADFKTKFFPEPSPEFEPSICGEEEQELRALEMTVIEGRLPALAEQSLMARSPAVRIGHRVLLHHGDSTHTAASGVTPSNFFRDNSGITPKPTHSQ